MLTLGLERLAVQTVRAGQENAAGAAAVRPARASPLYCEHLQTQQSWVPGPGLPCPPRGPRGFVFRVVFSAAPKGGAAPCFHFKMKTLFSLSF